MIQAARSGDIHKLFRMLRKTPPCSLHHARTADITSLLFIMGADVNSKNEEGLTPLHCAMDDPEKVKVLLLAGSSVMKMDTTDFSPIHLAIRCMRDMPEDDPTMPKLIKSINMIANSVPDSLDHQDSEGLTPISRAVVDFGGINNKKFVALYDALMTV